MYKSLLATIDYDPAHRQYTYVCVHISKILFLFPDPSGQKPILVKYKTDNNGNFPGKWNPPARSQFRNAIALKKWVVLDTAKVRDNEWDSFLNVS